MEEMRPDSEQLLKRIQYEEKREQEKNRGKMKGFRLQGSIFLN